MVSEVDESAFVRPEQADLTWLELLAESVNEVSARSRRYVREPSDPAWYELVRSLSNVLGDADAYEFLRAVEIHADIQRGSRKPTG
jgi:hypothetical protein